LLETVHPGNSLGFLNHHLRSCNSLLGTTPDLIAAGLPDDTFTAIEGDDKPACAELKKRNKAERAGFGPLFAKEEDSIREKLRQAATAIEAMDDSQPAALQQKEAAFLTNETAPEYRHAKLLADLWCAAFVIKKGSAGVPPASSSPSSQSQITLIPEPGQLLHTDDDLFGQPVPAAKPTAKPKSSLITAHCPLGTASGITTGTLRDFVQGRPLPELLESEVTQLAQQYRFFHWHLAFPQVFDQGGFDCILGNPPWERVKIQEKEWFAERNPEIAKADNAATRKRLIESLVSRIPELYLQFVEALRQAEGESQLLRNSGLYPNCGHGDVNLYAVFAERMRELLQPMGRVGCVLPTGIATDDSTKNFFRDSIATSSLVSLFDFQSGPGLFGEIGHARFKFCLFTAKGEGTEDARPADFAFFLRDVAHLHEPNRRFKLSAPDIDLLNPNTGTCPIFKSSTDAELTRLMYRRIPVLLREAPPATNSWKVRFFAMMHMSGDSNIFRSGKDLPAATVSGMGNCLQFSEELFVPLYEEKVIPQFEHLNGN